MTGLLMKLDMSTRQWHADVDGPWLSLLRPTVNRAEYLAQLVRIYGLAAPFESACKYTPQVDRILGLRARAGLIAQDLLALGLSAQQVTTIPQCASLTSFKNLAEAAGWHYVIERATLLQVGIRRHLVTSLPTLNDACSYLTAFEGVGDHWPTVARSLDQIGAASDAASDMIAAANAGFKTVRAWFDFDAR